METSEKNKKMFSDAFEDLQNENAGLKLVNLLVSGKSGVGKSTLINTVFGEELAMTGIGKPVTESIHLIEKDDFPVRIYDTVGFELNKVGFDVKGALKSLKGNDIQKLIKKVQSTKSDEDDVHVVWYLVAGTSARIEDAEIAFIKWMVDQGLPVIVVLTKSYAKNEAKALKDEISKLVPNVKSVITVLAQKADNLEAFGIEELVTETFKILPEGLKNSFVHSQKSIELKRKEAIKIVNASMAATFSTGFVPMPGSDAPLMLATQSGMMIKITSIYGVNISKQQIETALTGVLGMYAALTAGKSLAGGIAKLLPGLGTIGGGLISGGVGMVITGALGRAYMELMELVFQGKVDLSSVTPDELTNLLMTLLKNYMPNFDTINDAITN